MRERVRRARSYACFYGQGEIGRLSGFEAVVLQPGAHSSPALAFLQSAGAVSLGYLALGEDAGQVPGPWARRGEGGALARNPDWGTVRVDPSHPAWRERCLREAELILAVGFAGLFLDTLDAEAEADRRGLIALVESLRERWPEAPLVANRGFALLGRLGGAVDGVVFESLSTTWRLADGQVSYGRVEAEAFRENLRLAREVEHLAGRHGFALFALDYADDEALERYARGVARRLGYVSFVSDRALSRL